jgi:ABC-2 type transport system ATP-binding protein
LTAEENLEFYARVWRLEPSERVDRIRELLDWVGLWDRRSDRVGTWSQGMKQKLALARALLHRPALVFLDEPTAGLDVMAANEVREKLTELVTNHGTTVLLTTHNMTEAQRLCEQVVIIREGRLLASGTPKSLIARTGGGDLEEAFLALMKTGGDSA